MRVKTLNDSVKSLLNDYERFVMRLVMHHINTCSLIQQIEFSVSKNIYITRSID